MRAASIDVGTNTTRLLVADCLNANRLMPIYRKEVITRLGEGFIVNGTLSKAAMDRTMAALSGFQEFIQGSGAEKVTAVATSVVRQAKNRATFIERARREAGITIHVISGETEATLAAQGALLPVKVRFERALIFDVGGGSTEFILTKRNNILMAESIDLGVVHLAEECLHVDPPDRQEITALENIIRDKILKVQERLALKALYPFKNSRQTILIGIAGTPTTLAAIDLELKEYNRERINNHLLGLSRIVEMFEGLREKRAAERLLTPGLQRGREDLILPGALIVRAVMTLFGFAEVRVIDSGILEGLLLSNHLPEHQSRAFPTDNEETGRRW